MESLKQRVHLRLHAIPQRHLQDPLHVQPQSLRRHGRVRPQTASHQRHHVFAGQAECQAHVIDC
eukprot:46860-Eustigmatos_ZCMA.PRE.1